MKYFCLLVALLVLLLTGCATKTSDTPLAAEKPVKLIYYTIGTPDEDLQLVNDALNELLLERYGFTVEYHKIDWNHYTNQLNAIMHTDQDYDIAFAWNENYVTNAQSGSFLDLTNYLQQDGQVLYDVVDVRFWQGITINGQILGVPTNKELATPIQFLFSQELVEKYNIDTDQYRTLESLEPLLKTMYELEPDCIPLFLDSSRIELMTTMGYEYLASNSIPLVINTQDPACQIVNIYETEEARQMLHTLHHYYTNGYINQDASLRTSFSRYQDEEVFCRLSSGGPDSSASFSVDFGYTIITVYAAEPVVTSASTQGSIMVINANTSHPEEAMTFLTAVNTDPDVRNLLNYGIEGIHYELTDKNQVQITSQAYRGVPYTQGNWFILRTTVGESIAKWDEYRTFNQQAVSSPLLGFVPDYSPCIAEYNAVSRIYKKYDNALMTGSVDPDVYLPKLLNELKDAGIDVLIEELQSQIDTWLAQKSLP